MTDLKPFFDGIAEAACDAVEFEAGETSLHSFEFKIGDTRYIEGTIECTSDWCEEHLDEYGYEFESLARGCQATVIDIECCGFECDTEELTALVQHIDSELTTHVRTNYPD